MDVLQRFEMNSAEDFWAAIGALEEDGLDTKKLIQFMEEYLEEDYRWPDVLLREFFREGMNEVDASAFDSTKDLLLGIGIKPEKVDMFVDLVDADGKSGLSRTPWCVISNQ